MSEYAWLEDMMSLVISSLKSGKKKLVEDFESILDYADYEYVMDITEKLLMIYDFKSRKFVIWPFEVDFDAKYTKEWQMYTFIIFKLTEYFSGDK